MFSEFVGGHMWSGRAGSNVFGGNRYISDPRNLIDLKLGENSPKTVEDIWLYLHLRSRMLGLGAMTAYSEGGEFLP